MARRKRLGAGYRQRKDGSIEFRWTDGETGKRFSVYGKTLEECKEKEAAKKAELLKGYTKNKDITLKEYFSEIQEHRTVKPTTIYTESIMFKPIEKAFPNVKVADIERRQVQIFQDELSKQYSTKYTNTIIKLLNFVMKQAVIDGIIEKNPCLGIKALKRKEPEVRTTIHRALSIAETETFFKAAESSWYYFLYVFLINTGVRIGECSALQRRDIDLKKNVIHIRRTVTQTEAGRIIGDSPKSEAGKRDIPLTAEILRAIRGTEKQNAEMFGDSVVSLTDTIFKAINGGIVRAEYVRRDIQRILKNTDIEYFAPHAFRDTFATRALESGMSPKTLQEILGHANFSMTMDLYAHVLNSTKQKEMKLIRTGTEKEG